MYLAPLSFLDLGELIVIEVIVRIHIDDLTLGGRAQNLDDLDQMIDAVLGNEEGSPLDHFQQHAAHRPHVDHSRVVIGSEDQLGGPVAPRADVGQVGFIGQDLS